MSSVITIRGETFEDGSATSIRLHPDGHTQITWRVRTPDGRIELLEWWIDAGNPIKVAPPTTLDEARALCKAHGIWDTDPWERDALDKPIGFKKEAV